MTQLVDSLGKPLLLGKQLGRGGEGTVYEVPSRGENFVAKIYHEALPQDKQHKLRAMVTKRTELLERFTAWPLEAVYLKSEVRGFLMEKATGYEPVHHFYSPADRKQRFPEKDWAFLVHVARNIATAFSAIHHCGHVIGDVNPNFVFVTSNGLVKLIDCDSFQIVVDNQSYLCEVGVPHFTPPELQSYSSFRGIQRSPNHDNFGLALLIFHILMMGRHPFSGIYSMKGDISLEKAIEQFCYAFGRGATNKGLKPPPNCVTPSIILPDSISAMFERAFTEQGIRDNVRPLAHEWVTVLDSLINQLCVCNQVANHKYLRGLKSCPWCELEQRAGIVFFIASFSTTDKQYTFNLARVWAQIIAVVSPQKEPLPTCSFNTVFTPKAFSSILLIELRNDISRIQKTIEEMNKENGKMGREAEHVWWQLKVKEDEIQKIKDRKISDIRLLTLTRESDEIRFAESNLQAQKANLRRTWWKQTLVDLRLWCALMLIISSSFISIGTAIFILLMCIMYAISTKTLRFSKSEKHGVQTITRTDLKVADTLYQQELNYISERKFQINTEIEQVEYIYQEELAQKTKQIQYLQNIHENLIDQRKQIIANIQQAEQICRDKRKLINSIIQQEKQVRQTALDTARSRLQTAQKCWNLEAEHESFQLVFKQLSNSRTEYEKLLRQLHDKKEQLARNVRESQLHKFLSQFFIRQYKIPNIGATRVVTLASFGIETAADIERSRILGIRGFGEQLAAELINWRRGFESQFVFNPAKGVDPADIRAAEQRFAPKLKQAEGVLLAGLEQLTQLRQQRRTQLSLEIQEATRQVKQAEADLSLCQ